jgi:ABC-type lipoprotein export system ATPase subunit
VSLTIDQGELAAIVGPPGSGKTTLVHLWPAEAVADVRLHVPSCLFRAA